MCVSVPLHASEDTRQQARGMPRQALCMGTGVGGCGNGGWDAFASAQAQGRKGGGGRQSPGARASLRGPGRQPRPCFYVKDRG